MLVRSYKFTYRLRLALWVFRNPRALQGLKKEMELDAKTTTGAVPMVARHYLRLLEGLPKE